MSKPVFEVRGLNVDYGHGPGSVRAVRDVDLTLHRGEVRYHHRDGSVVDLLDMSEQELRDFRWKHTSIVFQGAMNSLNPVHQISDQLTDVIRAHDRESTPASRKARAKD